MMLTFSWGEFYSTTLLYRARGLDIGSFNQNIYLTEVHCHQTVLEANGEHIVDGQIWKMLMFEQSWVTVILAL